MDIKKINMEKFDKYLIYLLKFFCFGFLLMFLVFFLLALHGCGGGGI